MKSASRIGLIRLRRLRRAELPVGAIELAKFLIGKTLVVEHPSASPNMRMTGRIVEAEAYLPGDAAAHSFRGRTKSNNSLFLDHGHSYVYFTYGSSFMFNVSAERDGVGAGVLVRALEPLEGVDLMREHRGGAALRDVTRGPGRLAAALRIDKRYDALDLCEPGPIWLGTAVRRAGRIGTSTRIGITRETRRPWRFYERGNPFVSGPKWLSP